MAILQDEDGTNFYSRTYTPKVFDKNGHSVVDRLAYIEEDDPETVEPMSPYLYESDVVNNFTDGGSDVPLSAECGKTLYNTLASIYDLPYLPSTYTDYDDIITPGRYVLSGQTLTNQPFGNIYGYLEVIKYGDLIMQKVFNVSGSYAIAYIRRKSTSWGAWKTFTGQ